MDKVNLASIETMEGHQFEDLIGNLLIKIGFKIEENTKSADGGIDIIAYSSESITGGKYIIQCKRHNAPISEHTIRDLYGVVTDQKANKGVLVTNSSFTSAAIKFAAGKPLELIDGKKLIDLIAEHLGVTIPIGAKHLNSNQELLFRNFIQIIDDTKNKYNAVKGGLVFKGYTNVNSVNNYLVNIAQKEFGFIIDFIEQLGNLMNVLMNLSKKCDNPDIIQHIKLHKENTGSFIKSFFDRYESFYLRV